MTMTTSPVTGSAAFWAQYDPVARLKANVKGAFDNDDLLLVLMVSRPPTREECEMGLQVLDSDSDDLPFMNLHLHHESYGMGHNIPVGLSHALVSADWAHLHDVIAARNSTPATENPNDLLSLAPATALSNGAQWYYAVGQDTYDNRGGQARGSYAQAPLLPTPYRWALLTTKSMFQSMERTWARASNADPDTNELNYTHTTCVFDFRGGIPLSVGPHSSNANVWLGEMDANENAATGSSGHLRTSRQLGVNIARIHIPVPTLV